MEGSFPFVTFCNSNKMISTANVYLGIDSSSFGSIQEIKYKRDWIAVKGGKRDFKLQLAK